MKGAIQFIRSREWLAVSLGTAVGVLAITGLVTAATTISTDITTAGNVYATSTVQAGGALIGYATMNITGDATLVHASTTQLSNSGASWFTGDTTLGHASTTQITNSGVSWLNGNINVNGFATTTATTGDFATAGKVTVVAGTYASTTLQGALLTVYGDATLAHASTTQISVSGLSWHTGDASFGHASTTMFSNIQTANNATTTAYMGCIQTFATSTVTPIKLSFASSGFTANATTTFGATSNGFVTWSYGNCP